MMDAHGGNSVERPFFIVNRIFGGLVKMLKRPPVKLKRAGRESSDAYKQAVNRGWRRIKWCGTQGESRGAR